MVVNPKLEVSTLLFSCYAQKEREVPYGNSQHRRQQSHNSSRIVLSRKWLWKYISADRNQRTDWCGRALWSARKDVINFSVSFRNKFAWSTKKCGLKTRCFCMTMSPVNELLFVQHKLIRRSRPTAMFLHQPYPTDLETYHSSLLSSEDRLKGSRGFKYITGSTASGFPNSCTNAGWICSSWRSLLL